MAACTAQAILLTGASPSNATVFPVDQNITQLPAPGQASATGNTGTGSSFTAAQVVNIELTYLNAAGETTVSVSLSVNINTTGNNVVVTLPTFPFGVTGMNVYVSTTSGGSTYQLTSASSPTSTTSGGTVTITAFPSGHASPPGSNTATVTPVALLFNQSDDNSTTTNPILVPTATGTDYSYEKCLGLQVLQPGTTNITAIGWQLAQALTAGFYLFYKDLGASYVQSSGANQPANSSASNGAVPSTYTAMTTTTQNSWTGSVATNSTGVKGDYTSIVFGVGNNYAGAGGTNVNLVSSGNAFNLVYNEQ